MTIVRPRGWLARRSHEADAEWRNILRVLRSREQLTEPTTPDTRVWAIRPRGRRGRPGGAKKERETRTGNNDVIVVRIRRRLSRKTLPFFISIMLNVQMYFLGNICILV